MQAAEYFSRPQPSLEQFTSYFGAGLTRVMLKSVLDVSMTPVPAVSTPSQCRPHFLLPSLPHPQSNLASILQVVSTAMPISFPAHPTGSDSDAKEPAMKRARLDAGVRDGEWSGDQNEKVFQLKKEAPEDEITIDPSEAATPEARQEEDSEQSGNDEEMEETTERRLEILKPVSIMNNSKYGILNSQPNHGQVAPHLGPLTLDVNTQPCSTFPSTTNTFDESLCSASLPSDGSSSASSSSNQGNSLSPKPVSISSSLSLKRPLYSPTDDYISQDARFESFADFEEKFDAWKRKHLHPFRVASSEALREPDGSISEKFKYRYVVYHCAHYGEPRMRGIGKRPNQNYLPSGCKAMLRLNYSFNEKCLKVTTINAQHVNHEVSLEMFQRVSQKIRRSIKSEDGTPSPTPRRSRGPIDPSSTPLSSIPDHSPSFSHNSSLNLSVCTPTTTASAAPSPQAQVAAFAALVQQQNLQMMMYLSQQKENMQSMALRGQLDNLLTATATGRPLTQFTQPVMGLPSLSDSRQQPRSNALTIKQDKSENDEVDVVTSAHQSQLPAPIAIKPTVSSSAPSPFLFTSTPSSAPSILSLPLLDTCLVQIRNSIIDSTISPTARNDRLKDMQNLLHKWNTNK
ncbi:hypothetical protein WR25_10886 [Diploscapter pachys]|uniref:ZSWIM3 N-terminal domain-containing protein n=1 Tax=Diploscapter pachys TaxID=2018661 RepID=A0A2A2LZL8_9BILA|nr:hypothetical protein WR25_10886 [Diploscapter pachys]